MTSIVTRLRSLRDLRPHDILHSLHFAPRGRDRLAIALAWASGLACLLALMHRFRLGADVTDETFSIALPYRFVLGDKPFVDEISIQQTAGLVLFPFVWAFVKITGGTTGLVLFVRAVHLFVIKGIAALSVYAAARRWLKHRSSAIAISFVPFAFVPHSIPNVGYNVLGMALLTAGTFLCGAAVAEPGERRRFRLLFCAGLCEAFMSFAYPPMAVAAVVSAPLLLVCVRARRLAAAFAFVAGGAAATAALLPALRYGGVAGVRRALGWGVHANQIHTTERLKQVLHIVWEGMPAFFPYALGAIALAWALRSRSLVAVVVPGVTLALLLWNRDESTTAVAALHTVMYVGIFAPALLLLAKPDGDLWRGATLVLVPSFGAAIAAGFTSTQGPDASSLGFHAALVLFAVLAVRALERHGADGTYCIVPPLALMFVLVMRCYDFVYRDAALPLLTQTVAKGPFKGIRTSVDRARAFAELSEITATFDTPHGRVLVLYEAPGLYLFSKMRPAAHCVWEVSYADQEGMLAYWQRHEKGNGIVVRLKGSGVGVIDETVAPRERIVRETPHFTVYRDQ